MASNRGNSPESLAQRLEAAERIVEAASEALTSFTVLGDGTVPSDLMDALAKRLEEYEALN